MIGKLILLMTSLAVGSGFLDTCGDWGSQGRWYTSPVSKFGPACTASNAVLVCDDPIHEFRPVWAGQMLEHEFKITNIGTELAKVRIIYSVGGTLDLPRVWIEPGQTVGITVFLRTDKLRGRFAKATILKLESIQDDTRCFACNDSLDGRRHLEHCGPLCPPYEQASFAHVIPD